MCYHKQDTALAEDLMKRYQASMPFEYVPYHYENGFDFKPSPVLASGNLSVFQSMNWGLVPWWAKSQQEALQIRMKTLNAVSEEMFDKPSFRDALKQGKRCLIPCTGFFEWRWFNGGKVKYPYFVSVKDNPIFSLAGIWSEWNDKSTGEVWYTYSVLTTVANPLMEKIHNSKKRMPVILPQHYEKDWLNPNLTRDDVIALCQPYDTSAMDAHTISRMITNRKVENKDVPEISQPFDYPELALLDS